MTARDLERKQLVQTIALIKNISYDEVARQTSQNFMKLFKPPFTKGADVVNPL